MNSLPIGSSGIGASPTSSGTAAMPVGPPKPASLTDTIRQLENQIASYGLGPHTQQQREELAKFSAYLQRAKVEHQKIMNANINIKSENSLGPATISPMMTMVQPGQNLRPAPMQPQTSSAQNGGATGGGEGRVLDKRRLQELVKEVDPLEQLDDDVEDVLLQIADDFIENVVSASCQIAKHRKSNTLEVKDVQLYLERSWNMWVPGFGSDDIRPYKKAAVTEAHKQRMALIRKTLKKY